MMRALSIVAFVSAAAAAAAQEPTSRATDAPAAPVFLAAARIVVSPQVEFADGVERVELWASADGRRTWRLVAASDDVRRVQFDAPADGRYDLVIRLISRGGASVAAPGPGAVPTTSVIVDTIPPVLQLHAARWIDATGPRLQVRLSQFDEHLGPAGVRLFYRAVGATRWQDGGALQPLEDYAEWTPPQDLRCAIELRVLAADRAGNIASDELRDVPAPPERSPTSRPADAPAPEPAYRAISDTGEAPPPPAPPGAGVPIPHPPSAEVPLPRTLLASAAAAPAAPPEHTDYARVARLRALAGRHLDAGEHALAAARLDDALRAAPGDLDTLLQYAGVLTATGDLAAATGRYLEAQRIAPHDPRVLDGLGAAAAARGDFPAARAHLRKLLEIAPDSGRAWLHYGDVEHRLGRGREALAAWRRARDAGDGDVRAGAARRLELLGRDAAP